MLESNLKLPANWEVSVPGDKSISHRSVLFSALAKGTSEIHGFLEAEDPLNTLKSFSQLGLSYEKTREGIYIIKSPGKKALQSPKGELDFGNAGTGIRLSAGLVAGLEGVSCILTGDASLRKRPMMRIIEPLQAMGADIRSEQGDGRAPLHIQGKKLKDFFYKSPIASAQVKSCLMLSAISSDIQLKYEEEELSRDHTENMLRFLGGSIQYESPLRFKILPPFTLEGAKFKVPGDISSAAFFMVLGLLAKSGEILIRNIGLNPARIGILTVLKSMNARIFIEKEREECGEKIGDLRVLPSELKKTEIPKSLIPSIIDEIPILSIAGLFSKGGFSIRHAEELRAKESDRIHSMVINLRALGLKVDEFQDGYEFDEVRELKPCLIQSFMDHRVAMSFYILKTLLPVEIQIDEDSWIDTSFPNFKKMLSLL